MPGISDHHMVVADFDVKPKYNEIIENYISKKMQPRPISNQIYEPSVCTLPTLLVQFEPNGKILEKES